VRFVDLLRTTVLLSAGAATTLGVITVAAATTQGDDGVVILAAGWWVVAALLGGFVGRRSQVSPAIGRLLASAKAATMMPEHRPGAVLVNRLWPLLVSTIVAGALGFLAPQIPGIATGFAVIWALAWRRQESAVVAIEERDGVTFYVASTSAVGPVKLVRTPGLRRDTDAAPGAV